MDKEQAILKELEKCIVEYDASKIREITKKAIELGIPPSKIIQEGLAKGLDEVGEKYEVGEAFLPDLILAGETMKAAMELLEQHLEAEMAEYDVKKRPKVVIGTVKGDIHDIGKNIVIALLKGGRFEVIDLGVDVDNEKFVSKVRELKPRVLGMSALMTTTRIKMGEVIKILEKEGLRDDLIIAVGGAAVTEEFAKKIRADIGGLNAVEAVKEIKRMVGLSLGGN